MPAAALALVLSVLLSLPARACEVALLLAIDVSQSIDMGEYRLQADGIAEAVMAPEVREALLDGTAALAVLQWSGPEAQTLSIPWTRMHSAEDIRLFAERARRMPRAHVMSNTAVGAMLRAALGMFGPVDDCRRKVIDVSGDGNDNAGTSPEQARREAEARDVMINALAIEGLGRSITNFYTRSVITQGGFVMTSRGLTGYAETLRAKIFRETARTLF